jgi:hypothetical protein
MTFGGGNLPGQNIPVAWQNQSAENSDHSNNQLIFNLLNTLFYERWTRPTVFGLRTPPPNVISRAGLTLLSLIYCREQKKLVVKIML